MMKNQSLLTGDIFVIPNRAFVPSLDEGFTTPTFMMDINCIYYSNSDLNVNKIKSEDTRFIECWFCNEYNENWRDHGIRGLELGIEDKDEPWRLSSNMVPEWIFDGKKEGDVVTFNMPVERRDHERGILERSTIKLSMVLNQSKYRYRNFGKFEEVLKRV